MADVTHLRVPDRETKSRSLPSIARDLAREEPLGGIRSARWQAAQMHLMQMRQT